MDEYSPPDDVVSEWARQCSCCPQCSQHPCDGVAAGGMCDNAECECDLDDAPVSIEEYYNMMRY
jgi:hypothetical protein